MHGSFKTLLAPLAALAALWATPATAQVVASFVSSSGADGNLCTEPSPCRTFQRAHDATAPGGSVNVLDAADYGQIQINKSIVINGNNLATITSDLVAVRVQAAATDRVVIDDVLINGITTNAVTGIYVLSARDVVIRNTIVKGFGDGVLVNTVNLLSVVIENSTIANSRRGIQVDGSNYQAAVRLYDSLVVDSSIAGVLVTGALARAEISGNQIIRSPKPLQILNGAAIYSYGDNVVGPGADVPTPASKM